MNLKIVQMDIKIVQNGHKNSSNLDIKIEPINFVHDHFFLFFSKLVLVMWP